MTTDAIDPVAFDVKEVRLLIHEDRVGGWWRREVPPAAALVILHDFLATGELDEGWERGYPYGAGVRHRRACKGAHSKP